MRRKVSVFSVQFLGKKPQRSARGFTLVEMIVAVALFAVVMIVCVGALLALVNANRKAQALQSVMNNLNVALDSIVRSARRGSDFDGSGGCTGGLTGQDCTGGSTRLSFQPYGASSQPPWLYVFVDGVPGTPGMLKKSTTGLVADAVPITAPEVTIDYARFYVVGTAAPPGDLTQPKIVIVLKGSAGVAGTSARTTFHIQATAVQRILDL